LPSALLDTRFAVNTVAATQRAGVFHTPRILFPYLIPIAEEVMTVKPLNDRILVQRVESEEKSAGGIIIPDTAKEKPQEGTVKAVGPGKLEKGERVPMQVSVGQRVLFGKYSGTDVTVAGEELVLLREDEVYAVIES
jgi:chaperonin GroES